MCITPEAEAPKGGVTVDIQELKRLIRNLEDASYNEGALDLAVRCHDAHDAILSLIAEIASLRKQLYAAKDEALGQRELVAILQSDLSQLRSSRQADIERAVRLTFKCLTDAIISDGTYDDEEFIAEVLSQMEENNGN